jgi:hypothetical protein
LQSKSIKRNARHRRNIGQRQFLQRKDNKETSHRGRKKRCRKDQRTQLVLSASEDGTEINDQNICDEKEENGIETCCEKCFICEECGEDRELWCRYTGLVAKAERSGWEFPYGYLCDVCHRRKNTKRKNT